MAQYSQASRRLRIDTPVGPDVLLIAGLEGHEAISELFEFRLNLVSPLGTNIEFEKLLAQPVTVSIDLPGGMTRYVNGIVRRFSQANRDETFDHYQAEIVPAYWLWTQSVQSRIFQQMSTPDILKAVLDKLRPNLRMQLTATYNPRDFTVQYRESDFAFACRLMEAEGIYYFFEHDKNGHTLVLTDAPVGSPDLPQASTVPFEPGEKGERENLRVLTWQKTQEVRSNKFTLWDYTFEIPKQNLQAATELADEAKLGTVTHKLKLPNVSLEDYAYPGAYAKCYDGVSSNGGDQAGDLQHIFEDNRRLAGVRAQEAAARSLTAAGTSNCGHFTTGFKFNLSRHFDGNGEYLLTRIEHKIEDAFTFQSDQQGPAGLTYRNRFECLPTSLPYRPACATPKPVIAGLQTAVVVGPAGEEIFVDKYGRVKVQFHWDRQGKNDAASSCWVRVAQVWAGNTWGAFFWPRIGHEVVVAFEEGDPDQPLIVGSVYNAKNMPPTTLPKEAQVAGFKSCIFGGQPGNNFNAFYIHDSKGTEYIQIHSETNEVQNSEKSKFHYVPKAHFQLKGSL